MGDKTGIEWTDSTWNPVSGCSKVSQGCKNCYAERLFPRPYPGRKFTDVRTHAERLFQPLQWQRPRCIFVNSMSDLFHEDIPEQFIVDVFGVMALAYWHTFQVLTKRPERMHSFLQTDHGIVDQFEQIQRAGGIASKPVFRALDRRRRDAAPLSWPFRNVWLGISAEDQPTFDERAQWISDPIFADWNVFLSAEPLLGLIDIRAALPNPLWKNLPSWRGGELGWVIAGGESGPKARPMHGHWARFIRDQCAAAGVPFFFKQWGEYAPNDAGVLEKVGKYAAGRSLDGAIWDQFPAVRS